MPRRHGLNSIANGLSFDLGWFESGAGVGLRVVGVGVDSGASIADVGVDVISGGCWLVGVDWSSTGAVDEASLTGVGGLLGVGVSAEIMGGD